MAIIAENNMITFVSKDQTLTSFYFTEHIEKFTRIEDGYTLMFQLDDKTNDFVNLLDITDELGIKPLKINKEDLFMNNRAYMTSREEMFNSSNAVIDGFAIWYDTSADNVTLKIIYLDNPAYKAVMTKIIRHMEVSSSNMPLEILYRMKFIVERNEELLMGEWKEAKNKKNRRQGG